MSPDLVKRCRNREEVIGECHSCAIASNGREIRYVAVKVGEQADIPCGACTDGPRGAGAEIHTLHLSRLRSGMPFVEEYQDSPSLDR